MFNTLKHCLAAVALAASLPAHAAVITLTVPAGGSDVETIAGLTLGNAITFEYQFQAVTYGGGPFLGFNASVVNPPLVFPAGQFNVFRSTTTGWLSASIDTSSVFGAARDLAFTANTFGATANSATILVRNVAIDGRVVAGQVPEPATLALLAVALLGAGFARRRALI